MGPPNEPSPVAEEKNWRNSARPPMSRQSTSREHTFLHVAYGSLFVSNALVPSFLQPTRRCRPRLRRVAGSSSSCLAQVLLLPRLRHSPHPKCKTLRPTPRPVRTRLVPPSKDSSPSYIIYLIVDLRNSVHNLLYRPVDVTAKESAVEERLAKEREAIKERAAQAPMSRTTSRGGFDRSGPSSRGPPSNSGSVPPSPRVSNATANSANVRPATSFAAAASARRAEAAAEKAAKADEGEVQKEVDEVEGKPEVSSVIEQLGEVTI